MSATYLERLDQIRALQQVSKMLHLETALTVQMWESIYRDVMVMESDQRALFWSRIKQMTKYLDEAIALQRRRAHISVLAREMYWAYHTTTFYGGPP